MPVHLYWGEDDFAIAQAVKQLQNQVLDPDWLEFNYHRLTGDRSETTIEAFNQIMTPVFGMGERLVWLENTTICQQCSKDLYAELEETMTAIPHTAHLLLTTNKIDGRLNSTKLIKKHAIVKEFNLIPPWETQAIEDQVAALAKEIGVKLSPSARELLAESVGNNTRQLWNELAKLSLYQSNNNTVLEEKAIAQLVVGNTQNSLKLAEAILQGRSAIALTLVRDLINRNEPPLKIVATLVSQFRTWTIIKLMQERGERDSKTIAHAADVRNPNRIYHLSKEIYSINSQQLLASLPILLDLEYNLKRGADYQSTLQTKAIELCYLFKAKSKSQ
ncbi:MAG: DNA polymerase III subunit delta [Pleurocapsa sp.]